MKFPLIHPEAECTSTFRAYRTVLSQFNGLPLLNLHVRPREAINDLKRIIAGEPPNVVEADAIISLQSLDWRVQLIGCGAMLVGIKTQALLDTVWGRLYRHSWVAPQLAATACLLDPAFAERGLDLVSDAHVGLKSFISVVHLLRQRTKMPLTAELQTKFAEFAPKYPDNCEEIIDCWLQAIDGLRDLLSI